MTLRVTPEMRLAPPQLFARVAPRLDGSPLALFLDVDGTLAPIAARPEDAAIPVQTRDVVSRLTATPGTIVVLLTGRSALDAHRMLDAQGIWIIGNHGLELRAPDGALSTDGNVERHAHAIARARTQLASLPTDFPGSRVEDKRWSLAVHYRLAAADAAEHIIARATRVADDTGLPVLHGKKMVELRPPVNIDKGSAALRLAQLLGALRTGSGVFFAGDDRTDEDAFRALREAYELTVTVRIASEDDGLVDTGAEFVLRSPAELRDFLDLLARRRAAAEA